MKRTYKVSSQGLGLYQALFCGQYQVSARGTYIPLSL